MGNVLPPSQNLTTRAIFSFAAAFTANDTDLEAAQNLSCGYVEGTSVPDHAAGILFSVRRSSYSICTRTASLRQLSGSLFPSYRPCFASSAFWSCFCCCYQKSLHLGRLSPTSSSSIARHSVRMLPLASWVQLCFGYRPASSARSK